MGANTPRRRRGQTPKSHGLRPQKPTKHSQLPRFTVVPRLDICAHATVQVLDIVFDNETWQVINFYHHEADDTSIRALLALDISATTPTLVIGDFNAHSRTWSLPGATRSTCSNRLEEWAATNLLTLASTPREITRRGASHESDSVLDLAWYNEAAVQAATFSNLLVDWSGNLGSDHAMIHISGQTREHMHLEEEIEANLGFVVDQDRKEEWTRVFKTKLPVPQFQLIPSTQEIEDAAASLTGDISATNEEVFKRRRPFHPRASPWWSSACDAAVQTSETPQAKPAGKLPTHDSEAQ